MGQRTVTHSPDDSCHCPEIKSIKMLCAHINPCAAPAEDNCLTFDHFLSSKRQLAISGSSDLKVSQDTLDVGRQGTRATGD